MYMTKKKEQPGKEEDKQKRKVRDVRDAIERVGGAEGDVKMVLGREKTR